MRQLESNIRKNRFDYKLVKRDTVGDRSVAIYSQHDKEGEMFALEVFIVPVRKKDVVTPTKVLLPAGETFPSNERFGIFAKSVYARTNPTKANQVVNEYFEQFKQHLIDEQNN